VRGERPRRRHLSLSIGRGGLPLGARWRHVERCQERQQVIDLRRAQPKRPQQRFTVGMQAVDVQIGVVLDHRPQRRFAAVVHVGCSPCQPAQAGRLPLAPVARLQRDGAGRDRPRSVSRRVRRCRLVVVGAQKAVGVGQQASDARVAPWIDTPGRRHERNPHVVELAVREARTRMADRTAAFADEQCKPAPRGDRIPRSGDPIARRDGVPKAVEGRTRRTQGFEVGRECLADIGEHAGVVAGGPEDRAVVRAHAAVGGDQSCDAFG